MKDQNQIRKNIVEGTATLDDIIEYIDSMDNEWDDDEELTPEEELVEELLSAWLK